ncbi:hypothetical protein ACRAWD_18155 [Caulobacter segnis]
MAEAIICSSFRARAIGKTIALSKPLIAIATTTTNAIIGEYANKRRCRQSHRAVRVREASANAARVSRSWMAEVDPLCVR